MSFYPYKRAGLVLGLSTLFFAAAPGAAHATIYFSAPGEAGSENFPVAPTELIAVDETTGQVTALGSVTYEGEDSAISALAMSPQGEVIGFLLLDPQNDLTASIAVSIDIDTLVATAVSEPFVAQLNGAAYDRFGGLWVTDRSTATMMPFVIGDADPLKTDQAFALPVPPEPYTNSNGHDIAFDVDNNCYYIATSSNSSSPLYACDVEAGSFEEIGPLLGAGFGNDPETDFNSSCLAFSLSSTDCEQVMAACDGWAEDEVGIVDLDTLTFNQTATLGVNLSWYNWPDMAGFPSVTNTPECDFCGNGELDMGEECDDANEVDDDACSNACLWNDSDGDGVHDGDDVCPGFDDSVDTDADTIPDGCDNCPEDANPDQADADEDNVGDVCDESSETDTTDGSETDTTDGSETDTTDGSETGESGSDEGDESDSGDDVGDESGESGSGATCGTDNPECLLDDGCTSCSSDPKKSAPYSFMVFIGLLLLRRRRRS
ncbi:hypothetical protein G6O69_33885 [Pseudenhygromyxa sp. WMMC2535]|uniref:hypothetical protein n=1 Tax=Pseudenhygromyxa sp. WMMC2535 TaxID=2712867 RepID=UPI001595FE37|nr:hypothetical protein [Pseudenhygromyxa sp. WMMC2535]NVB42861.1 hypothetical protein [Pseudenhygromyxa sp. WMMC2535]